MTKTVKYTLLKEGYLRINETGAICPPRGGNYISNAVIEELKAANCASEDGTGLVAFIPDGKLLVLEEEEEKEVAKTPTKKPKVN